MTRGIGGGIAAAILLFDLGCSLVLANDRLGLLSGYFLFCVLFFCPGYLFISCFDAVSEEFAVLLAPLFGMGLVTALYAIFRGSFPGFCCIMILACASAFGMAVLLYRKHRTKRWFAAAQDREMVLAGAGVSAVVSPLFWRSGRYSGDLFQFYGPAGRDHLYHLTLVQRLLHHVPPDNFIFARQPAPMYHYYTDLMLSLVLRAESLFNVGTVDIFDLYYRCYPTILYFLLGGLAYSVGRRLTGSSPGGLLGVLLVLGGSGLGWILGFLQTAVHLTNLTAATERLFSPWSSWDGIGSVLPLVHRPAHYEGLLFGLGAIVLLSDPERRRVHYILSGLLLGLMAGFNYTLAATMGVATAVAASVLATRKAGREATDLACCAAFIFIGSLPKNVESLLSGFRSTAPGFPFEGPNLRFPTELWSGIAAHVAPAALVPVVCLALLILAGYGLGLFGLRAATRLRISCKPNPGLALVIVISFLVSFAVGTFFTYRGIGGDSIGVIFLQPSRWMLALFALCPIADWLERGREGFWRAAVLFGTIAFVWVQSLFAFNVESRVAFTTQTTAIFAALRSAAAPDDVVAYLPTSWTATAVLGPPDEFPNYAVMAMTGLDGYFSSRTYSEYYAVPGLMGGRDPISEADRLYEQRLRDVTDFLMHKADGNALRRLRNGNVRWIVVTNGAMHDVSPALSPWRADSELAVYRPTF